MLLLTSLALIGAITFTSSCKKKDTDSSAPTLVIDEPAAGETVTVGDSLHIEGTVTDASLHELNIKVTKNSNGATVFNSDPVVHDLTTYFFHAHYAPVLSDTGACTVTVTVADHSENITKKTVTVTVLP